MNFPAIPTTLPTTVTGFETAVGVLIASDTDADVKIAVLTDYADKLDSIAWQHRARNSARRVAAEARAAAAEIDGDPLEGLNKLAAAGRLSLRRR